MGRLAWMAVAGSLALLGIWWTGWGTSPADRPAVVAAAPSPPRDAARRAPDPPSAPRADAAPRTEPPAPPERAEPLAVPRAEPPAPRFDVARLGRSGALVTAGRAAPGAEVVLLENGREIGRGRADPRGEWVILPEAPLGPGARELSLLMRLPGAGPVEGESRVVLLVPDAPAVSAEAEARPGPLALMLPAPAARASPVLALQAPVSTRLSLDLVDYGPEGDLRFAGGAPPGAVLRIYLDGAAVGDAVADRSGRWSFVPSGLLSVGRHTLRVDQLNAQWQVTARIEQPFHREAAPVLTGATAAEARRIVQPGHTLWRISREVYGRGTRFTLIFEANREQIRDPHRIFPGQVFSLPAPAASSASR